MAEIELTRGDLLKAHADALVNTVNCVGVMGKGVALQFKRAFPENFRIYKRACDVGQVTTGRVLVVDCLDGSTPRFIVNFPTKIHWRDDSRLAWIRSGLEDLVRQVAGRGIRSIALPPLGCGNGGLDWADVRPLIEQAFAPLPGVHVLLFEPLGAPAAETMDVRTKRPRLTRARAILIRLLRAYELVDGQLTKLEVQKLAYFLQAAGEPLRLGFVKHQYGPYAEKLNFVLQDLEGHYLRGYGDRTVASRLHLLPGAVAAADEILAADAVARRRLRRVSQLIEGFESPYGMELLATVHWVASRNESARRDIAQAIADVGDWNPRKKARYQAPHVAAAWQRLTELGWLEAMHGCGELGSYASSTKAEPAPGRQTPPAADPGPVLSPRASPHASARARKSGATKRARKRTPS